MLNKERIKMLAGFNFPKFNAKNGAEYLLQLKILNDQYGEILYGMPILEDSRVAYKESRIDELRAIRSICNRYKDLILQIRVGATDFSSCFGVRRGVDYSIYDILTVREILSDIPHLVLEVGRDCAVTGRMEEQITIRVNAANIGPLGLGGDTSVLATFLKIGPQRASGVRIVCLRPMCCFEPRIATVDLQ